ncbi:MAG: D-alanine--D-alanine ligase family protein [Halanaerobiales bacterium]
MGKLRIGLIFGGRSKEHEISILSARSVYNMADKSKYDLIPFAITKEGYWLDSDKSLMILEDENITEASLTKTALAENERNSVSDSIESFIKEKMDLVFPVLHGPYGEDGRLQGMLEMLDIPYVGAGVLSSAAAMDKAVMKQLFSYHKIPQGSFMVCYKYELLDRLDDLSEKIENTLGWPCFIKPANMGSSIGISKVYNAEDLYDALLEAFKYDYKVVIEEFISGREVECSVFGNTEFNASLPGEIRADNDFYDYNAKYQDNSTELIIPAELDDEIIAQIRKMAIDVFKAVDGRGFSRVDFFVADDERILVNEINTIPGFTRYSMYAKLWEASGIEYSQLIDRLINLALEWQSI